MTSELPRMFETCLGCGICKDACPVFVDLFALGEARKRGEADAGALTRAAEGLLSQCYFCGVCEQACPIEFKFEQIAWARLCEKRAAEGVPAAARRRARPSHWERWARRLRGLLNWGVVRGWLARFLGIDRRMQLPAYAASETASSLSTKNSEGRPVVLFAGCAASVRIPDEVHAAREILERSGFSVTLASEGCCGLSAYAEGLADEARAQLRSLASELARCAGESADVLVFDAPCLKMLLKNAPVLEESAALEGLHPRLFDASDYLWCLHERGELARPTAEVARRVAYHAPCASKALGLASPALKLLGQVPGIDLVRLESGCCGLAGAWGMCAENFERSQQTAEKNLFEHLREAAPELAVSECPQCRLQIESGAVAAAHPLTIYRKALGD